MSLPSTTSANTSSMISLNVVPARTGIAWVKSGIRTFFKQPLALGGLFFMNMALTQIIGLLPYVGLAISIALIPAFNAGMLIAAQTAEDNKFPMPLTLFSAIRKDAPNRKNILLLGVFYIAAVAVLITIFNLIFPDPSNAPLILEGKLNEKLFADGDFQTASLVVLALQIPIGMLFWHAPALVHWHGVSPAKSLFFSFVACYKNMAALVVFFFMWLAVFSLGGLILTLVAASTGSESAVAFIMLPAALLMAAMFFTSIHFTFKDSFLVNSNNEIPL